MRLMYKRDTRGATQYVAVSASSETLDYQLCRLLRPRIDTVEALEAEVRRVFRLGAHDELILQYEGEWDSEVVDGHVQHPFLPDLRVAVPVSR